MLNMKIVLTPLCMLTTITYGYPSGLDGIIITAGQGLSSIGKKIADSQPRFQTPDFQSHGRERAILEVESKPSQLDSAYTYAQNYVAGFYNPQPLVDTIQEYEKYGNHGEQGRKVSTAIVNGFDGIANAVNTILDIPYNKAKHLSKTATAALNAIGAPLVGL